MLTASELGRLAARVKMAADPTFRKSDTVMPSVPGSSAPKPSVAPYAPNPKSGPGGGKENWDYAPQKPNVVLPKMPAAALTQLQSVKQPAFSATPQKTLKDMLYGSTLEKGVPVLRNAGGLRQKFEAFPGERDPIRMLQDASDKMQRQKGQPTKQDIQDALAQGKIRPRNHPDLVQDYDEFGENKQGFPSFFLPGNVGLAMLDHSSNNLRFQQNNPNAKQPKSLPANALKVENGDRRFDPHQFARDGLIHGDPKTPLFLMPQHLANLDRALDGSEAGVLGHNPYLRGHIPPKDFGSSGPQMRAPLPKKEDLFDTAQETAAWRRRPIYHNPTAIGSEEDDAGERLYSRIMQNKKFDSAGFAIPPAAPLWP